MKLIRWTIAGASFYVIYKYGIGKKLKGEDVFASPDSDAAPAVPEKKTKPRIKRTKS